MRQSVFHALATTRHDGVVYVCLYVRVIDNEGEKIYRLQQVYQQVAQLSQRGHAILRICQQLA